MAAESLAAVVLAWLGTYALHSTLLLALAWGLCALASRSRRLAEALPLVREGVWRTALLAGIATASVQVALRPGAAACLWTIDAPCVAREAQGASLAAPLRAPEPESAPRAPASAASTAPLAATRSTAVEVPPLVRPGPHARRAGETPLTPPAASRAVTPPPDLAAGAVTRDPKPRSTAPAPAVAVETLPAALDVAPPSVATELDGPAATVETAAVQRWTLALLALWLGGVAFGGLRWLREWASLRRTLRRRVVLDRGEAHETLARLCARSGTRRVRLSSASGLPTPITVGVLRHEIVIPPRAMSQLSPDELEAMLAHELAHARRDDPLWLWIYRALEVVLFFQPLNRLARVKLQDDAELCADDWAATQVAERVSLASCLTEIAGWIVHERQRLPAPAMAARGSRLARRVHRLLDDEHHPERARRPQGLLLLAGSAALGVALFGPGVSAQSRGDDLNTLSAQARADELNALAAQARGDDLNALSAQPRADEPLELARAPSPRATRLPTPLSLADAIRERASDDVAIAHALLLPLVEAPRAGARLLATAIALGVHGDRPTRDLHAAPRALAAASAAPFSPRTAERLAPAAPLPSDPKLRFLTDPFVVREWRDLAALQPAPLTAIALGDADTGTWRSTHDALDALERELDALRARTALQESPACVRERLDELASELRSLHEEHTALLGLVRELHEARAAADRTP